MNTVSYPLTNRDLLTLKRKMKNKQKIRRRIVFIFLSLFLALLFSLSMSNLKIQANEKVDEIGYKYFTVYEIEMGDTLWNLAEKYIDERYYESLNQYIEEVKEINHLKNDNIVRGDTIVLPYYSNEFF